MRRSEEVYRQKLERASEVQYKNKIVLVSVVSVLFELLEYLRIYLVVNMNRIVMYKDLVKKKKKIPFYLIEIEKVNEYKIEKIKVYVKRKPKIIGTVKGLHSRK